MAVDVKHVNAFQGFTIKKVLNSDKKVKSTALCGHFQNDPDHDAVILVDKVPMTTDSIQQIFDDKINIENTFWNDIYGQFLAYSCKSLGDIKLTVVYPADSKHIAKYSTQDEYIVKESMSDYLKITKPYIETQALGLEWVYNILNGESEADRVIYSDPDPLNGFIILPDLKWDTNDKDNLYLIAIVRRRDLQSLRDVNHNHAELLKRIQEKGKACIQSTYDINGDQLRFYIHYHPSFYHLHVHITNLKYDSPGIMIGRAHLLDDVIDNIESIDSQYYQKRKLSFVLKETHGLTAQYRGIQNQYNGRTL